MRQETQAVYQPQISVAVNGQVQAPISQAFISSTVIIPAYNEEEGIAVVLEQLSKVLDESYEVIVVDDGSTDATAEIARRFHCKVISHPENQGKAAAVRTGIAEAHGENVILIDADNTYPCEAIPLITEALEEHAIVMGSRSIGRKNIPLFNRIGNGLLCALIRRLYGYQGNDPFTGLYGVKRSVMLRLNLNSSGFEVETELAIKAGSMGLKILEIPIKYSPRIGEAKLRPIRDGVKLLQTILRALALFNPTFFFVLPGFILMTISMLLMALLAIVPVDLGNVVLRSNTLILAAMLALAGFQTVAFGIGIDLYAMAHKFTRPGWLTRWFLSKNVNTNLRRLGGLLVLAGTGAQLWLGYDWMKGGFDDFTRTNELVSGSFLGVFGLQLVFSSVFFSVFVSDLHGDIEQKVNPGP